MQPAQFLLGFNEIKLYLCLIVKHFLTMKENVGNYDLQVNVNKPETSLKNREK